MFATDIDEAAIAAGRAGYYPEGIAVDVPPSRLRTSFSSEPGGYRVSKALRDSVIFAVHNVLRDPPFSRLDLVSCRNLLIYLDRAAQQQVLEMFHFSLRPGGYLFLGTSETVDVAARFFTPVDTVNRLYRANPVGRPLRPLLAVPTLSRTDRATRRPDATPSAARPPTAADVHRQLLEEVAAAERAGDRRLRDRPLSAAPRVILRMTEGEPSHNLLQAIRPELQQELRTALFQALQLHDRIDARRCGCRAEGRDVLREDVGPAGPARRLARRDAAGAVRGNAGRRKRRRPSPRPRKTR